MTTGNAVFIHRLSDHLHYLERVRNTLRGEDDVQGISHAECRLGLWLYGEGWRLVESCAPQGDCLARALLDRHRRFHVTSNEALLRQAEGDYVGSYQAMADMLRVSLELSNLMLEADHWVSRAAVPVCG